LNPLINVLGLTGDRGSSRDIDRFVVSRCQLFNFWLAVGFSVSIPTCYPTINPIAMSDRLNYPICNPTNDSYPISVGQIADNMLSYKYRNLIGYMIEDTQTKKTRQSDSRIDVRFPDEIYEAIKSIAQKDGAKIHHRSGEIILTPTVVKLIRIGISHLSDDYQISLSDTHLSDNLTSRVVAIEQELSDLKKLVITLSDRLPDKSADKQSDTVSDESSSISNAKRAEAVDRSQPSQVATIAKKQKPEDEPDWVNNDNRRFYTKLINDPDLLAKVTESIDRHPKDNADLARSLVSIGFQKTDGTALDSAAMSRIKKVAIQLKTQ
jgi:hypothetical protein